VEERSGLSYDSFVKLKILDPLGLSNTRPELPEQLYGQRLAVGYSAMTREGKREKVNFFQANGISPAAGFSSSVEELGKFASWQFRLRDTTAWEILRSSTLKYMQQVHWTDPDWETTWGLGFMIRKGPNGNTWVGHGGSCPGYRSTLELDLKNRRAFSVMINASGTNPSKYVRGINGIMDQVKASAEDNSAAKVKDLQEYVGYYNQLPWWGEAYISTWNGTLVMLDLPSDAPGESMTFFKHTEGDTFRRVRDNGELGESLVFERDAEGNIVQYLRHGNYTKKIER
jgi:CubicO group peptidase (beta-lactamase class C family)